MSRRRTVTLVLALTAIGLAACTHAGCGTRGRAAPGRSVIVLGFDGMDYTLTKSMIEAGRLPNLARLAEAGGFQPLETSMPPQSPVAWSTFITGLDPGGHGIFDFIHRDPATLEPFLSTSRTEAATRMLTLGRWQIPALERQRRAAAARASRSGRCSKRTAWRRPSSGCRQTSRRPGRRRAS